MNNIKSISEAYSMQPLKLEIGDYYARFEGGEKVTINRIILEGECFVGYDQNNNKLFEYQKDSVNVHYLAIKGNG